MKRMLIDAAHPEELRVAILDGNRIDDFEAETAGKAQLKGNIYVAHVSRVEPSLQAAFITYGGNRNGFLAFGEVHPFFFDVKKSEKADLLEELADMAARRRGLDDDDTPPSQANQSATVEPVETGNAAEPEATAESDEDADAKAAKKAAAMAEGMGSDSLTGSEDKPAKGGKGRRPRRGGKDKPAAEGAEKSASKKEWPKQPIHRRYRIQDVLKEGQKILVQVVKEERGSKGAALTTYFSLPGRYTVLMPNTPHAGGISRKINDPEERRTLRDAYSALQVPPTMGLIIRTAGVGQPPEAIKRDYSSLTNLWDGIQKAFESTDDITCVHEDGSLIIRALRDMMSDDMEEVIVSGKRAYKTAKDYVKNLMPDNAGMVKEHKDDEPLFSSFKVEQKLNQLHHTRVTLPSGGYLIINPTEALVAVDINSGRATQERNIEETALKTNLEACEELARQIRLRDLAGLIVVDFIDMESYGNTRKVEQAMRKALRRDRARVQYGNISDFGLMEISRQRLRPSFGESHFVTCPHCNGSGHVHSPATAGLMILRRLEEDDIKGADRVTVSTSADAAIWLLNTKRELIRELESKYKYHLVFKADATLIAPDHSIELVTFKSDGSELKKTLNVTLREQPELPPEQRMKNGKYDGRRDDRDRGDRPERSRDDRQGRPDRDNRNEGRDRNRDRDNRNESRRDEPREAGAETDQKDENFSRGRGGRHDRHDRGNRHERRPFRADENHGEGTPRRPQRVEGAQAGSGAGAEEPEKHSHSRDNNRRGGRSDRGPRTPVAPIAAVALPPQAPKKPEPPAEDKPLMVEKVAAPAADDTPVIKAKPRKKMVVKVQEDTDATDEPLKVAKVTTEGVAEEATAGKKGLISRIIGR